MGYQEKKQFKPTRGYTYARNSPTKKKDSKQDDKELSQVYSIAEQMKKTRNMAKVDEALIIREFKDEYTSGKAQEYMTEFNEMIKLLIDKNNPDNINIIYCWRVDRLGRNQREMINTVDKLKEHNIYVKFVDGGFDTYSPIGCLIMGVLSAFAEWQRQEIVINTAVGREKEYKLHPERFGRPLTEINWKDVEKKLDVKDSNGKYIFSWSKVAKDLKPPIATATLIRRYKKEFGAIPNRRI